MTWNASTIDGVVSRQTIGFGTKSQHEGFVLRTLDGNALLLEVKGWGTFKQEPFEPFEGRRCRVEGAREDNHLIAQSVQALDKPDLQWSISHSAGRSCSFCRRPLEDSLIDHCPMCGSPISKS